MGVVIKEFSVNQVMILYKCFCFTLFIVFSQRRQGRGLSFECKIKLTFCAGYLSFNLTSQSKSLIIQKPAVQIPTPLHLMQSIGYHIYFGNKSTFCRACIPKGNRANSSHYNEEKIVMANRICKFRCSVTSVTTSICSTTYQEKNHYNTH